MSLSMIITTTFMLINNPLMLSIILIFQAILTSSIMGQMTLSFWFSYIMFLIIIGGMMVIFIYITSLASNELTQPLMKISLISIIMSTIFMLFLNQMLKLMNMEMLPNELISPNYIWSTKMMFNEPNWMITLIMMIYLLTTMIIVTKIVSTNKGSLRQTN
uniref:NADH-ubiquinone oxidoreductase chain 6 n=1 Tax=Nocticola sp. JW1 9/1 TaxID=2093475 RepID=A0A2P1H9I1_9NEOP|nr:NADH dehydrogenase subunit 6 [Nocticola sp. JW1 9/1]